MTTETSAARLRRLLGPLHDELRVCARSLARSRADGDDLFHDAALRAQQKIDHLRDDGAFRWWFYRVLLSVHRNRTRRSFWRRMTDGPMPEVGASGDDVLGAARLRAALASLDPVKREAVVLHELCGMSIEEIAAVQAVSRSAVKSRLSRARSELRTIYRKRFGLSGATLGAASAISGGIQ